jgi:hypothetical protein
VASSGDVGDEDDGGMKGMSDADVRDKKIVFHTLVNSWL